MNLGSDYSFGDTITCPLYKDNQSTSTNAGADGELVTDYLSLIDLNSILQNSSKAHEGGST
jgi:hypothetical protein